MEGWWCNLFVCKGVITCMCMYMCCGYACSSLSPEEESTRNKDGCELPGVC